MPLPFGGERYLLNLAPVDSHGVHAPPRRLVEHAVATRGAQLATATANVPPGAWKSVARTAWASAPRGGAVSAHPRSGNPAAFRARLVP